MSINRYQGLRAKLAAALPPSTVLIGPHACGKTTYAPIIAKAMGLPTIVDTPRVDWRMVPRRGALILVDEPLVPQDWATLSFEAAMDEYVYTPWMDGAKHAPPCEGWWITRPKYPDSFTGRRYYNPSTGRLGIVTSVGESDKKAERCRKGHGLYHLYEVMWRGLRQPHPTLTKASK